MGIWLVKDGTHHKVCPIFGIIYEIFGGIIYGIFWRDRGIG